MQTPTQIKSSIITFLLFKIEFNVDLKSFVFKNRKQLNEINENYFELELGEIFKNISNHLISGENNLLFLRDLEDIINRKTTHFENIYMNCSDDVSTYLKEEKTIEYGEANTEEFIKVFNLAKNYAYILYQFVDGLIIDFDNINFSEFDYDEYIKSHKIEPIYEYGDRLKCVVNLKKIDVAHLFKMLLDEKIFYFSENERKNKVLLKKFIEEYFLYRENKETIFEIKTFNKEYSEVDYNGEELHLNFLKAFRDIIDKRIGEISLKTESRK